MLRYDVLFAAYPTRSSVTDGSPCLLGDRPDPHAHKVGSGITFGTISKASGTSAPVVFSPLSLET